MSEISRNRAIENLKIAAPIKALTQQEFDIFIASVNKAISDMEKLEKIEQLFEPRAFGEYPCSYEDIAKEIENIVKNYMKADTTINIESKNNVWLRSKE